MGQLFRYRCNGCGNQFSAEDTFTAGWSGDVYAIIVCPEHGIGGADTGVNLDKGGDWETVKQRTAFPCRQCGQESPLWDQESCPKCGSETIEQLDYISYD